MKAAAKEHIPVKKRIKRPWLSTDTINIADQRKKQKAAGNHDRWSQLNKEFRKSAKNDQQVYLQEKCEILEKCSCNPKEASKIIKEITQTWKPQTEVINSKSGTTLTETEAILNRWAEYCEELYKVSE